MKAKTISPINIAAFFLLAACAVMGVVGLFLAWTGADIAGMGEVKVTLLEYGRVADVTGGVIPTMTALGSVAAVAMCFPRFVTPFRLSKAERGCCLSRRCSG